MARARHSCLRDGRHLLGSGNVCTLSLYHATSLQSTARVLASRQVGTFLLCPPFGLCVEVPRLLMNNRNLSWVYCASQTLSTALTPECRLALSGLGRELECGSTFHGPKCGHPGPLLSVGDQWTRKCSQQTIQSLPLESKLFAQMTHAAPGWILRMAIPQSLPD